jgi:DNA-binding response OmpR family regulator
MTRILVVEDRDEVRRALTDLLTAEGYEVSQATDGHQVPARIARQRPDLVLLDVIMPVMDGFEVLKALKAHRDTGSIPVVVYSGAASGANVQRARALGAADFIPKSSGVEEVLERVRAVLSAASG